LATTNRPSVESDERVALEAYSFAQEAVGQGVAGPISGRGGVEQLDRALRQAEGSLD
jgi:hypothetical protein